MRNPFTVYQNEKFFDDVLEKFLIKTSIKTLIIIRLWDKNRRNFYSEENEKSPARIMSEKFLVNIFLKKKEKNFKKVLIICEKRVIL